MYQRIKKELDQATVTKLKGVLETLPLREREVVNRLYVLEQTNAEVMQAREF